MGTAADFTIIVILVVMGAALWSLLEKVAHLQRELEALRTRLGENAAPPP
jgi:hypothetical protein